MSFGQGWRGGRINNRCLTCHFSRATLRSCDPSAWRSVFYIARHSFSMFVPPGAPMGSPHVMA